MTWNAIRHIARARNHAVAVVVAGALIAVLAPGRGAAAEALPSSATDASWLTAVNQYRAMAGLSPVVEDAELSADDHEHACYMLLNGMSHDELPELPGYTERGDEAGNSGNVAVSSDIDTPDPSFVDLWMTGPFHALGILRPNLETVGYGRCTNAATSFRAGATLDVIRGLGPTVAQTEPIMFPGNGSTTHLTQFVAETPNPLTFCGWTGAAGLPIVVLMPEEFSSSITATVAGPSGPMEVCVLSKHNTSGTARTLLADNNVVVAIPREPLTPGTYDVSVASDARNVEWSFAVDPAATLVAANQESATATVGQQQATVAWPTSTLWSGLLGWGWGLSGLFARG